MPLAIPQTVRRALGEEAVVDFLPWMEEWLSESIQEKAVPRDEYREVLSRLGGLEKDVSLVKEEQARMRAEFRADLGELRREMHERFAHIEERFDRVNERFDGMNERLNQMNRHFESRLDQMSERMLVQTRWLIGTIALFGTILTILMAIAQFTP